MPEVVPQAMAVYGSKIFSSAVLMTQALEKNQPAGFKKILHTECLKDSLYTTVLFTKCTQMIISCGDKAEHWGRTHYQEVGLSVSLVYIHILVVNYPPQ